MSYVGRYFGESSLGAPAQTTVKTVRIPWDSSEDNGLYNIAETPDLGAEVLSAVVMPASNEVIILTRLELIKFSLTTYTVTLRVLIDTPAAEWIVAYDSDSVLIPGGQMNEILRVNRTDFALISSHFCPRDLQRLCPTSSGSDRWLGFDGRGRAVRFSLAGGVDTWIYNLPFTDLRFTSFDPATSLIWIGVDNGDLFSMDTLGSIVGRNKTLTPYGLRYLGQVGSSPATDLDANAYPKSSIFNRQTGSQMIVDEYAQRAALIASANVGSVMLYKQET